jgi:hypothetical protein
MVRGFCLASLPQGGLVPITAFVAAMAGGLVLRSLYDLIYPIPVGDWRESQRHILQWSLVLGLAVGFGLGLTRYAGGAFIPEPDQFGPWLRAALAIDGALLAVRSVLRMLIRFFRPPAEGSTVIPELDARLPVHQSEPLPPMPALEMAEPDRAVWSRSNLPGVVLGAALFAIALVGWQMNSRCLLRLPQ